MVTDPFSREPLPPPESAVVIGGSAGAIQALMHLFPSLPVPLRVPVVAVVHLPPRAPSLLPELFSARCALPVREPCDKEPVLAGIWFAPPDYHLLIEQDRTFSLSLDAPDLYSRPSIDALFESAAECYRSALTGIVLTGASCDGARGARAIGAYGGKCFALTPEGSNDLVIMPNAAIENGATAATLAELSNVLKVACDLYGTEGTSVEKHP